MELDELKYQLKSRFSGEQDKTADELKVILHAKTKSVISMLKRSMYIELASAILFTIVFACIGLFSTYWSLRIYFGVFSIFCAAFIFVIGYLLKKTTQLSNAELPIKTNLQILVNILKEYIRRYFQFSMGLLPVCILFSFYLGYNEPPAYKPQLIIPMVHVTKSSVYVYLFFFTYFAALAVGLYYFTRWYLKKLYGNYLERLKDYVAELEKE
jgi:MFS family permease